MAIDSNDILSALSHTAPELDALPVEVSWPDQNGKGGETRRVIAVYIQNSGEPEVPTLVLICGTTYDMPQPTAEEVQEALDHWHDAPKPPNWVGTTATGDRVFSTDYGNDMPPQDANA